MERKIPKNVRQIGNVSDNPKIYVEDYVDTFFSHLCEKGQEETVGAFLIGELLREDDQDFMFFHGAIQMDAIMKKDNQIVIEDKTRRKAFKECKEYFEGYTILGWFMCGPDLIMETNDQIQHLHEKLFMKKSSVFVMRDISTKEDHFFIYKYNDLMELGGYYIYYEKNPSMQNYMISHRKQNGVTPSESVEDRAAKNFRSIVQEKEQKKKGRINGRLMYAGSLFLVVIIVAMGISTFNSYDKMKSVQTSLSRITKQSTSESEEDNKEMSNKENSQETTNTQDSSSHEESVNDGENGSENATGSVSAKEDSDKQNGNEATDNSEGSELPQGDENASNQVYVVEPGDTLAIISTKHYGDISHIEAICKMNGIKNGNLIYEGQKLLLP